MIRKAHKVMVWFLTFIGLSCTTPEAQNEAKEQALNFRIEEAPEWTALFKRDSGWFGGDGIFAIPMDGREALSSQDTTRNLFVFSDTMVGEIQEDSLQPGYTMVNNSVALLQGHEPDQEKLSFKVHTGADGKPQSLFVPSTPNSGPDDYFWLGDGFVNPADGNFYLFGYRIINIPERKVWGFEEVGNVLITIPQGSPFPFRDQRQMDTPLFFKEKEGLGSGSFGAGIFVNTQETRVPNPDGYIYVYGVRGLNKALVVARVQPEYFTAFERWTYWNGEDWTSDQQAMVAVTDSVSNELSLSPISGGRYALVFQVNGVSSKTGMRIGESPVGPFSKVHELWDSSEDLEEPEFIAYNAKAHPSLSKPGELLISYNINSMAFAAQIEKHPHLYRPRFFKVIFEE